MSQRDGASHNINGRKTANHHINISIFFREHHSHFMATAKTLDLKIQRLRADASCRDFILADAKDADMGFGVAAPGPNSPGHPSGRPYRSLAEFHEIMAAIVEQGLIDIMLMSASSSEVLTIDRRLFDESHVTPAVRANDTTDIWLGMSGRYTAQPSRPFRSATIDHIQCGHLGCTPEQRTRGANLGLYSVTFNNAVELDRESLEHYAQFRVEAESKGFRHFLEVFAPNAPGDRAPGNVGRFLSDAIARTLAGVTRIARPIFLKIPYCGPESMELLFHYDPTLVIGILGGSSGTTHDAFHLLAEAKKYGARAALFGRKINYAEDQLAFVKHLRAVADDQLQPAEAVRSYHGELQRKNIKPLRSLDSDLALTEKYG